MELERTRSQLDGKHVVVVTRSQLEGMPVVECLPVSDIEDVPLLNRKQRLIIGVVFFLVTVAIVVGLAVFFTNQKKNDDGYGNPTPAPEVAAQVHPPVLEALQERKVLRCGIKDQYGFSFLNDETNEREGFEVDLCKAVAAAALGSSYRYEIVPTTWTNRFVKLANGDFDVLIAATTHTFDRDVTK
jgi:ABC-type amino acid transport substrate-binding protein